MLDRNPKSRLGSKDKNELKNDPFFKDINWDRMQRKEYKPPVTEFDMDEEDDDELMYYPQKVFSCVLIYFKSI